MKAATGENFLQNFLSKLELAMPSLATDTAVSKFRSLFIFVRVQLSNSNCSGFSLF